MRKKTAKQTTKRQTDPSLYESGLIAKGKNSQQSATTESVLDNRSHRTTLQISCERSPSQLLDKSIISDLTMRTILLFPQRSTASFACWAASVNHWPSRQLRLPAIVTQQRP